METRKIAVACFIGGALTMAVALALTPKYWWFGLVAGIAGGYISYEFREVLKAIPIALRAVMGWRPQRQYWTAVGWTILTFFALSVWVVMGFSIPIVVADPSPYKWDVMVRGSMVGMAVGLVGLPFIYAISLAIAANSQVCVLWASDFRKIHYYLSPPIVLFWHLPRGIWRLPRLIVAFSRFFGRFAWHLFKLIHSQKRVLCAIDGALGGGASYIWLVPASATFVEQAMLVVCGGLLGSAFGVVNHEIVSKRLLHLAEIPAVQV